MLHYIACVLICTVCTVGLYVLGESKMYLCL